MWTSHTFNSRSSYLAGRTVESTGQTHREDSEMTEEPAPGRRRLTESGAEEAADFGASDRHAMTRRDTGVRATRRTTTWTAAALIAGVAVTTGYFAHAAATPNVAQAPAAGVQHGGAGATAGAQPSVHHPVAVTTGSGVTIGSPGTTGGGAGTVIGRSGHVTWQDN